MKRIVALIDFSDVTPGVIRLARDMARAFNCELSLLHVVESQSDFADAEDPQDVSTQAHALGARHREMEILGMELKKEGVDATTTIAKAPHDRVDSKILEEIVRLSPDLIVIGSHGHGRLYRLLCGSASDTVVRKAVCPVVLVPKSHGKRNSTAGTMPVSGINGHVPTNPTSS